MTLMRAGSRGSKFNYDLAEAEKDRKRVSEAYNFPLPSFAVKHPAPFNFFAKKVDKPTIMVSIHEPYMNG